jgi:hypothetical protein
MHKVQIVKELQWVPYDFLTLWWGKGNIKLVETIFESWILIFSWLVTCGVILTCDTEQWQKAIPPSWRAIVRANYQCSPRDCVAKLSWSIARCTKCIFLFKVFSSHDDCIRIKPCHKSTCIYKEETDKAREAGLTRHRSQLWSWEAIFF